ncbi:carbonic anhydrase [Catenulispora sp. GP43]|uniref:hypothetical protein n=1 Tax=Catenulispora sp. GP43 TaxID=3156263 RepID=UPI00351562B2
MIITDGELVRKNAAFAATGAHIGLSFPTNDILRVLGCVDSRAIARHTLPPSIRVSGVVYDVHTGLIEFVDRAPEE